MSETFIKAALFAGTGALIFWLWRRVFRGTGIMVLLAAWLILVVLAVSSFGAIQILFWVSLLLGLVFEVWRFLKLHRYKRAHAAFETNQILRGLSPAEAAYFIGLGEREVFLTALLNLLDKDVLRIKRKDGILGISLAQEYRLMDGAISAGKRKKRRRNTAREHDQIIHPFEDALIELVSTHDGAAVSEIGFGIWYQYLRNDLGKLAGAYDFHRTAEYARQIVEKMSASGSAFSSGKRNLSAWKAIRLFDRGGGEPKDHRPGWLAPDDDFSTLVIELRAEMDIRI